MLPPTEIVQLKLKIERGNRVQVPKLIWWRFKLEISEVLEVRVSVVGLRFIKI